MRVIVTLMLLLPLSGLAEQGSYYMWKDDEGVSNFSAQPPAGLDAEVIVNPEAGFGQSGPDGPGNVAAYQADTAGGSSEIDAASIDRRNVRIRAMNCAAAHRAKDKLTSFKQIIVLGEDGFWREATAEVRQQELALAETAIAHNCVATH